ncbi:hypothetical protein C5E51_26170 [Nocardia nova]|nr:hypothetical protein C5E51_26170 [Nocardia nova]
MGWGGAYAVPTARSCPDRPGEFIPSQAQDFNCSHAPSPIVIAQKRCRNDLLFEADEECQLAEIEAGPRREYIQLAQQIPKPTHVTLSNDTIGVSTT